MTHRVLFLLSALLLWIPSPGAAQESWRLGQAVQPTFQAVELTLDPRQADFSGRVEITLDVVEATDRFSLHAEDMEFTELTLTDASGGALDASHTFGDGALAHIAVPEGLEPGTYTLAIAFNRAFDTQAAGLYRMDYQGESYAFTQFEADDARQAFPCFDEPGFKFPYQVTLTVPREHMAVSNMLPAAEETHGEWKTTVFNPSPPMPSYLLAMAVGPLEAVDIPGMPVPSRILTVEGQSKLAGPALDMCAPLLDALARYFGQAYPYEKLDLLAVPEFLYGAMENPGAVTFADRILLFDPATATPSQRARCASVIAHEFAHMWFGDLVTMQWWDDLWLNESFASWMGDKVVQEVYPEFRMNVRQLRSANAAFARDTQVSTRAIRQPVENLASLLQSADVLAYNKGQAVLNMLEHALGEDTFRSGVLQYIQDHAWGNTVAEDLWRALSNASGTLEVTAVMASFLDQPGVPLITLEMLPENKVRLSQERFLNFGAEVHEQQLWRIPVVLKVATEGGTFEQTVLVDRPSQTVELNTHEPVVWVLPNAESRGYYRWNVAGSMMVAMAQDRLRMTAPERIGYLDNLSALVGAGRVSGDDYLRTLQPFAQDSDAEVIRALLAGLGRAHENLVPPEARDDFAVYVRHVLDPAKERFGLEAREGEPETVTMFRPQLFGLLGGLGQDEGVRSFAMTLAEAYMADRTSIDASLAGVSLRLAARGGDQDLFEAMCLKFETTTIPNERPMYLRALGCFERPELSQRALEYCLTGPLRTQELQHIPSAVGDVSQDEDLIWNWMTENYETISGKIPSMFWVYLPRFGNGCKEERVQAIHDFFGPRMVPGMDKEIATVTENIEHCAGLRQREGGPVSTYLHQFRMQLQEYGADGN